MQRLPNDGRRALPRAHPLPQPATRHSIQGTLQAHSVVQRNIRAGRSQHDTLDHVGLASFNASGSHLAVVRHRYVKVFETDSLQCVASFEGLGEPWGNNAQWGPEGTLGVFEDRQGKAILHGDLLLAGEDKTPHGGLQRIVVPSSAQKYELREVSPDLSKVFVDWSLSNGRAGLAVFDLHNGDMLWEDSLYGLIAVSFDVVNAAWHVNSNIVFYSTEDTTSGHGAVWAVELDHRGTHKFAKPRLLWHQQPSELPAMAYRFSVSNNGSWVTWSISFQDHTCNERAVLHWPSGQLLWRRRGWSIGDLKFDWEGNRFACFQVHPTEYDGINLCVAELALADGADISEERFAEVSGHLAISRHDQPALVDLVLSLEWSPAGDILAISVENRRAYDLGDHLPNKRRGPLQCIASQLACSQLPGV